MDRSTGFIGGCSVPVTQGNTPASSVAANLIMALIPLASVVLALTIPHAVIGPMLSGFTYVLYIPAMLIFGRKANRQRLLLLRGSAAPSVAQDAPDTEE
jgi:hypothetical protein